MALSKLDRRKRIRQRIRKVVNGTGQRPRLSVFRSNKQIYAQIINDELGVTLVAASSVSLEKKGNKRDQAFEVGKMIAKNATETGIKEVSFDRGGYLYHGRIKSLAEGAREGGLKF